MNLRDQRQEEFADAFVNRPTRDHRGYSLEHGAILYLCPRFGKCRVAIKVLQKLKCKKNILISYPEVSIKTAWQEEMELMGFEDSSVTYTTHRSLEKHTKEKWEIVIIDEIHTLSEAQIDTVQSLRAEEILGLTGTMSEWTQRTLGKRLGLNVVAYYPIQKAVEEGVVSDYEIRIKKVPLENKTLQEYSKGRKTEKKQFDAVSWVIEKLEKEKRDTKFLRMARMRIIQNSLSKMAATRQLLEEFKDERVLVFCGVIKVLEQLGCPVYHSGSTSVRDKQSFETFTKGQGNHLAVVKIGGMGRTYRPLSKVIINYFDSNPENLAQKINRCMAMEYSNPDKKAIIYMVTSDEEVELNWLTKALAFFDPNKIKFI